jgi:4-hydroxythreonine-4-phosphate dehydrogenase
MKILISSGEPAGIGPDICCRLAAESNPASFAVLGDPELFKSRAAMLGEELDIRLLSHPAETVPHEAGLLQLWPVASAAPVEPGRLDPANAGYVIEMLRRAGTACMRREAAALVTAPVHKSVISRAGIPFSGHTEFLAELTATACPVMLLTGPTMRVALATTHMPLARVPQALNQAGLESLLRTVERDLGRRFGIDRPRLLVLGLNPHAGEDGTLGREEIEIIQPVVERLRAEDMQVIGPVAADTAFTGESLARCDVVVAMYHDQGLTPLKAGSFGEIVNVTLGLPIVRTSVDHGTALGLAGTGRARPDSLRSALDLAVRLAARAGE